MVWKSFYDCCRRIVNGPDPWIITFSGRRFHVAQPSAEMVDIEDIANALSKKCRWAGHTRAFYSVAQHSVLVGRHVWTQTRNPQLALAALFHDGAEAYLPDIPRPYKWLFPRLIRWEGRILAAIATHLGIDAALFDAPLVHIADQIALATEARDLMAVNPGPAGGIRGPTWGNVINAWSHSRAVWEFLDFSDSLEQAIDQNDGGPTIVAWQREKPQISKGQSSAPYDLGKRW